MFYSQLHVAARYHITKLHETHISIRVIYTCGMAPRTWGRGSYPWKSHFRKTVFAMCPTVTFMSNHPARHRRVPFCFRECSMYGMALHSCLMQSHGCLELWDLRPRMMGFPSFDGLLARGELIAWTTSSSSSSFSSSDVDILSLCDPWLLGVHMLPWLLCPYRFVHFSRLNTWV